MPKSPAELDREINEFLAGKTDPGSRFRALIRSDTPGAMQVAEDVLLQAGWKLREVAGGLHARNFTIELKPTYGPRNEWKMVQTSAAAEGKPGNVWVKWSAANGNARASLERNVTGNVDDVKKMAVATAWTIAKAIKKLSMSSSDAELEKIVKRYVARGEKNVVPEELF